MLGYVWSLLRPLLIFVILFIVFTKFLKVGNRVPHYPVYLLLGILLWNYFVEVTSGSVTAIVGKGDLLRKINFPKYVIIISISITALINLILTSSVMVIFMIIGHVEIGLRALWLIPVIFELVVFSLSAAFILSAAFVRYRDISYIWEVAIQAAFYATPILYPLTAIPNVYSKILILNPMAQIIQDARNILVTNHSETITSLYGGNKISYLIPLTIILILAIFSISYFRKRSKFFAEES